MSRMERYHQNEREHRPRPNPNREQDLETLRQNQGTRPPLPPKKAPKPKKRKRKGKLKWFFILLLAIILIFTGYNYFAYQKGYNAAKNDTSIPKITVKDFNGEKSLDGSYNVLLLGSDSRGSDQGRSDTIIVVHYSKKNKTPKLVSFMRDTYVNIPGYGYNKLNAAYAYGGPELVRQTLKEMFGVSVQYYAIVNFESFPKVIDTLLPKGVALDAEKDLDLDGVFIKKGPQKMNGKQALQYARFRHDEEGDFGRVRRQQQVLSAVAKQAIKPSALTKLAETAGKVRGYTTTNLPSKFYLTLGKDYLFGLAKPLKIMTVPVENSWSYGSYPDAGSVLEIDEAANKTAVQTFLND